MKIKSSIEFEGTLYNPTLCYMITVYDIEAFKISDFAISEALQILSDKPKILFYRPRLTKRTSAVTFLPLSYISSISQYKYPNFIKLTF